MCENQIYLCNSINSFVLSNKAVADGSVSYFIDHAVIARVSRYACGIRSNTPYKATNQEHLKRSSQASRDLDGKQRLPNAFSIILPKVCW